MSKKINILYIETGVMGGGSFESLYEIVNNLDRKKFNPIVVFFSYTMHQERFSALNVTVYTLKDFLLSRETNAILSYIFRKLCAFVQRYLPILSVNIEYVLHYFTIRRIGKIIDKNKTDIIHLNTQANRDFFGMITAVWKGLPCISHLRSPRASEFNKYKTKYANKAVNKYIAYFNDIKQVWEGRGVSSEKSIVMYNAITPFTASALDLNRKFNIPLSKTCVVGCVGSIEFYKAYDFMITAFERVVKRLPHVYLLIVGGGDKKQRDELLELSLDLNIEDSVGFVGFEEEAREIIASLDILVLPYKNVCPFGRVLLEAWQLSIPVIATNIDPINNIVKHGYNGLLVELYDVEGLSNSIVTLLLDNDLRKEISNNGFYTCNKEFNMKSYIKKLESVYISILKERPYGRLN